MPHATLSHVLGPLPPLGKLGTAQSGGRHGEFQAQESPSFPVDASDEEAVIVLDHRPSWLNLPLYTYGPEGDATVAGFWAVQALAVAHTFHPSRQPHLLRATLRRSALCRPNPAWGEAFPPTIPPAEPTLKEIAEREALRRSSGWFGWWVGRGREGGGRGGSDGSGRSGGSAESEEMEQGVRGVGAWVECAQLEAAELFTLSASQRLIHLQHPPQADLIRAQASAKGRALYVRDVLVAPETVPWGMAPTSTGVGGSSRREEGGEGGGEENREGSAWGGVFEVERGLCHAPFIVSIHKHRMGRQLNVDGEWPP
ncbi:unnamed protein product [Closterium sp. Naga37s-1]|nr:unnamed protein product [Closterium sp. Naga37s-1]